jgi:hypothetical protein
VINADNSIINLREKLVEADRKKAQSAGGGLSASKYHQTDSANKSSKLADIIEIRNENKLAGSNSVRTEDKARELLTLLKEQFSAGDGKAKVLHQQVNADSVMGHYPFD